MSAELLDALQAARAEDRDPQLAAFRLVASPDEVRAAWLLSIVVDATHDDLADVFAQVWPERDHDSIEAAIHEVETWPFVRQTAHGLQVSLGMTSSLTADFAETEPDAFHTAHDALVRLEELREVQEDPDETWAIRGRIAFYLAAIRPEESVEKFGMVFGSAPSVDRTAARIWISSLALRQEPLLRDYTRELSFYRGFRAYVMGDRPAARREFETVLAEPGDDVYEAISLHLLGVMIRRIDPDRGIALLKQAIALSRTLGIRDNEVMARASLATAYMARAQETMQDAAAPVAVLDLEGAARTARDGLALAEETPDDEALVAGLRQVAAVSEWLALTENRRSISPAARNAVPRLDEALSAVMESSQRRGDYEQFIIAGNSAASIFVDIGEVNAALSRLERIVDSLEQMRYPPARVIRIQQTTGRLLGRTTAGEDRDRARDLLERLDALASRLPLAVQEFTPAAGTSGIEP